MTRREKLKELLDDQRTIIIFARNNMVKALTDPTEGIKAIDEDLSALIATNVSIADLLEMDDVKSFDDVLKDVKEVSFLEALYGYEPGE